MIKGYRGKKPSLGKGAFVADGTIIVGDVRIGEGSSIWYGTVIRGDVDRIVIGRFTNIQDGCMIHCDQGIPTIIGDYVTVGHSAVLHGCKIADNCLIGMGATVMDGVEIGEHSIIGAGALIPPYKKIPPGSVVMGFPGKIVRNTTDREREDIRKSAESYMGLSEEHSEA